MLLEASDKVLMAFDTDLQQAALNKLRSGDQGIAVDVRLSAGVQEVTEDEILLSDGTTIKHALALWAAGIGTLPFVQSTAKSIPEQEEVALAVVPKEVALAGVGQKAAWQVAAEVE